MKILVTGAAGFLGSHLCDQLLHKNYDVLGVDNFFRGSKDNLPTMITNGSFSFFECDLRDPYHIKTICKDYNPDIVIHYAAINGTKYFYDIPLQVINDNIKMTQNILSACEHCAKKIIYASSSEVYGPNPKVPTKETEPIELHVNATRDSYASSKAIGEFLVKLWAENHNKSYLILRPFNTYGPRMATNGYGQVIPEFIERIHSNEKFYMFGDGKQTRSFCYVTDHANIVADLLETSDNQVLNIGYDEEVTIYELAKQIHEIMSVKFEPSYKEAWANDTKWRKPDISNIKKYYNNFVCLSDGLKKMIKEYNYENKFNTAE